MDGYDLKYFADVCYKTKWRFIAWGVEEIPESLSPKIFETKMINWYCNQNVLNGDFKNQDLLKSKKQEDYWVT